MSAEFWTFLGITVTAIASVIGTVLSSNKKTREGQISKLAEFQDEQAKQISQFQKDTRVEMSKLQDAYADSIVEVKGMINDLKSHQEKMQATVELRLDTLEKKQDLHNSVIERTYKLEQQVAVLDNREKVSENRLSDLERHEEKQNRR